MKTSLVILTLSLFGFSAFANPAICVGQEGTVGQLQLSFNGNNVVVQGSYGFRDTRTQQMTPPTVVNCGGQLSNHGQAGIAAHDYFELNKGCAVHYLRTEKDQAGRLTGWISVVTRGQAVIDSSGYTYYFFLCH